MTEDPILNAPIQALQQMLRTIASAGTDIPLVVPDGIYGDSTRNAVSEFQKKNGLPVTGTVDHTTHQALVRAHNHANELLSPAESSVHRFPASLVIQPGQYHPHVRLAQAMQQNLRQEFPGIPSVNITGYLDGPTQEALKLLQTISGITPTGHLDKTTWNRLSRLYRCVFDRNHAPSQG